LFIKELGIYTFEYKLNLNNIIIRRRVMKKLVLLLSAVFMVASLSACATNGGGDNVKVKCPACGHEFSLDTADTGKQFNNKH
jgi:hypothetical protein